jgi:L-methionine (R)-S-oxide reductase
VCIPRHSADNDVDVSSNSCAPTGPAVSWSVGGVQGEIAMSDQPLAEIIRAVVAADSRRDGARQVADLIRRARDYRWVGVYDVEAHEVAIIAWSGAGQPSHPRFARTRGLTGAAVATAQTVVVNDVAADPRYLDAFGDTRAEIIVPVVSGAGDVCGTIDVESDVAGAFTADDQAFLESCARIARPLWS